MALEALNDLCKVKLESKRFVGIEKDTAESGILVSLPDKMQYFGFWSFAFESSLGDTVKLKKIYEYWEGKIGRKVFWTALSERGNIIEKDGEKYAFLKLTSLIAEDDPDSDARSIHSDGAGSFGVEQ
jgi:hypothetical protein